MRRDPVVHKNATQFYNINVAIALCTAKEANGYKLRANRERCERNVTDIVANVTCRNCLRMMAVEPPCSKCGAVPPEQDHFKFCPYSLNGRTIITKIEDCDDDDGVERAIPIGMSGVIGDYEDYGDHGLFNIAWENGAWTRWTAEEIANDATLVDDDAPNVVKIDARYGEWFDEVKVNGVVLDPTPSQKLINHSPDGFAWGYGGSGPAQLALAILLAAGLPASRALTLYQRFKREVIARQPERGDWTVEIDVHAWAKGAAS